MNSLYSKLFDFKFQTYANILRTIKQYNVARLYTVDNELLVWWYFRGVNTSVLMVLNLDWKQDKLKSINHIHFGLWCD